MRHVNLVFVYGTLKGNGSRNHVLGIGNFVGNHTTEPEYTMYNLIGFPAIVKGGTTGIKGELYHLEEGVLEQLDMIEGVPNLYSRGKINTRLGESWVYYMEDKEAYKLKQHYNEVKGGEWNE